MLFLAAIAGASQVVAVLQALVPHWVPGVMSFFIIVLITVDFMQDYGRKATVLHLIAVEPGEFEVRLRAMLQAVRKPDFDSAEVAELLSQFELAMVQVTARAGYAGVGESPSVAESSAQDAKACLKQRYYMEESQSVS